MLFQLILRRMYHFSSQFKVMWWWPGTCVKRDYGIPFDYLQSFFDKSNAGLPAESDTIQPLLVPSTDTLADLHVIPNPSDTEKLQVYLSTECDERYTQIHSFINQPWMRGKSWKRAPMMFVWLSIHVDVYHSNSIISLRLFLPVRKKRIGNIFIHSPK